MIEMTGSRVLAGLAALGGSLMLAFAGVASASTGTTAVRDAASTRAFIRSELQVVRVPVTHESTELAAGQAYVGGVQKECGDVQLRLRRKVSLDQALGFLRFGIETVTAYEDHALASLRPKVDRTAAEQDRLRFSDPELQWSVRGSTSALAAQLALKPPDVCADLRRMAATKLKSLTPAGRRFAADALALTVGPSTPIELMRKMRRYAPDAVASGLKRLAGVGRLVARSPVEREGIRLLTHMVVNGGSAGGSTVGGGTGSPVHSVLGYLHRARL
jgi:hypothetical protein